MLPQLRGPSPNIRPKPLHKPIRLPSRYRHVYQPLKGRDLTTTTRTTTNRVFATSSPSYSHPQPLKRPFTTLSDKKEKTFNRLKKIFNTFIELPKPPIEKKPIIIQPHGEASEERLNALRAFLEEDRKQHDAKHKKNPSATSK